MYLLLLVEISEDRKASFASELGASHNDRLTGGDRNIEVPWICLTHLKKSHKQNPIRIKNVLMSMFRQQYLVNASCYYVTIYKGT